MALCIAAPAHADLKSYNAAVSAGDHAKAAEEAKSTWATWDMADPNTALIAREFGLMTYIAGDFAAARKFGEFLRDKGATLAKPDDMPITSRLLLAAANYGLNADGGARQELLAALQAREASFGLDMQTVLAAEALYNGDMAAGNWSGVRESAKLAEHLIERGGDKYTRRRLDARAMWAEAGFLAMRSLTSYGDVVDTHNEVIKAIDDAATPEKRKSFYPLKFNLEAWAYSIEAYFDAQLTTGTTISRQVDHRRLDAPREPLFDDADNESNRCEMLLDIGAVREARDFFFRGAVATAVVKADVDANGRMTNAEILAAVPYHQFADNLAKALPAMRYRPAGGARPGCTLAGKSVVTAINFYVDSKLKGVESQFHASVPRN